MKKEIFIAMLLSILAMLSMQAQSPIRLSSTSSELCNQSDPLLLQTIKNAEARLMNSYNDKNKPRLKPTRLSYEWPSSEFEQEMMKRRPQKTGRWRDVENYNRALKVATKAEKEKEKAERVYVNLTTKQFEKENTRQMDKAQKNLEKATRNYYTALNNLKRTREELEKYR